MKIIYKSKDEMQLYEWISVFDKLPGRYYEDRHENRSDTVLILYQHDGRFCISEAYLDFKEMLWIPQGNFDERIRTYDPDFWMPIELPWVREND